MKKFNLFVLLLGLCNHVLTAQVRVHLGATSAFNSTFVLDKGLSDDPRYNAEMTYKWSPVGIAFGTDFSNGFGLQLESILSRQGQIYQIVDIAQQQIGERKIDLEYIHLPLLLNLMGNSNSRTSFNFMFGPQLSILTQGQEIYQQYKQGTLKLPEGGQIPQGATDNGNGTYTAPPSTTVLASTDASAAVKKFKETDLQLAVGFGLNIDIGSYLYLSTNVRGNYGFTDMRNEDLINSIKQNSANDVLKDLFGRRANMLVGVQIGLHYMFGGNRTAIRSIGPMGN
jgi:hypothetical protein